MKFLFFLVSSVFSLATFAQTNIVTDADAKARTLNASFSAITVTDGIDLYLSEGQEESLAVSYSDEKYAEHFKTIVENGVLKIFYDNNAVNYSDNNRRRLKAYVSFKTLEKLSASGGANVELPSSITVNDLQLKFTSGANFNGSIKGKSITIDQSSGSEINLSGSAEKVAVEVTSGATFKGYDFAVDYCDAKASTGGGVRIAVQKELTAKAHSGGGIRYKGSAVIRDIDISSGGIVKKA
ncbi:hypothetical protein BH11BAC4_BH11BAC4_15610 [soil metagenome]